MYSFNFFNSNCTVYTPGHMLIGLIVNHLNTKDMKKASANNVEPAEMA